MNAHMKKQRTNKILFLDILTGDPALRQQEIKIMGGETYAEQMRNALGLRPKNFLAIDASRGQFPDLRHYRAVVIGGSYEDPVRGKEKPWMKKVYRYIRRVGKNGIPLLGVCGGLQFTVRALGGNVIYNPKGRELGNVRIRLTPAGQRDWLFAGTPPSFIAQLSHTCMAEKLKPGWRRFAKSRQCAIQAIAIGDRIRLVQFHPEMTARQLKAIVRMRKAQLIQEGFVGDAHEFRRFFASIRSTDRIGKKILQNFICRLANATKPLSV